MGQLSPGAADEGAQNSLTKNILTTIKVNLMKFAEWANTAQQPITIFAANLFRH